MTVGELVIALIKHASLNSTVYVDGVEICTAESVLREPRQVIISASKNKGVKEKIL